MPTMPIARRDTPDILFVVKAMPTFGEEPPLYLKQVGFHTSWVRYLSDGATTFRTYPDAEDAIKRQNGGYYQIEKIYCRF